jgi:voltage-gated potassium channel
MKRGRRAKDHYPAQAARKPSTLRHWLHEVLEHGAVGTTASRVVNGAFVALILVNVAAVVLESVPDLARSYGPLFSAIEIVSLTVFTLEYLLRLWTVGAHDARVGASPWRAPVAYATSFGGIVDLLSVLPFWLVLFLPFDLRVVAVFRVFRFLKLARYSLGVRSLLDALYQERGPLAGCVVIFAGITLLAASLMYLVERHVQPEKFGTIPLAMWWAVTTLGTTGYGDVVPVTLIGRILNAATIMCALVMIALPVGLVATAFADQIHKRDFVVTWGMVARVPLFAGLGASDIASVMRLLSSQTFGPGDVIVRRGEAAESMFFIASGEVEIQLKDEPRRLGAGHFFGEVGVLKKARRSATVTAVSRCNLLVLNAANLRMLMQEDERVAQAMRKVTHERLGRELVTKDGDVVSEEIEPDEKPPTRGRS